MQTFDRKPPQNCQYRIPPNRIILLLTFEQCALDLILVSTTLRDANAHTIYMVHIVNRSRARTYASPINIMFNNMRANAPVWRTLFSVPQPYMYVNVLYLHNINQDVFNYAGEMSHSSRTLVRVIRAPIIR